MSMQAAAYRQSQVKCTSSRSYLGFGYPSKLKMSSAQTNHVGSAIACG
jgi:hypothetical protein